jgi:hypothetical protein
VNDNRYQHLSEAFNSIISMMLAAIRARGLRSLIDLPNMIMAAIYLRRLGREFAAVIASLKAGTLHPPAPAQPTEPGSAPPAGHIPAALSAAPAKPAGADRARPTPAARPAPAAPKTSARRTRTPQTTRRPHRTPDPRAIIPLPAGLLATERITRKQHQRNEPTHVNFVTISKRRALLTPVRQKSPAQSPPPTSRRASRHTAQDA